MTNPPLIKLCLVPTRCVGTQSRRAAPRVVVKALKYRPCKYRTQRVGTRQNTVWLWKRNKRHFWMMPNYKTMSRSHALRGNAVKARCAASCGLCFEISALQAQDAARPIRHSHAARGNEETSYSTKPKTAKPVSKCVCKTNRSG
jgi:hypothetical protein